MVQKKFMVEEFVKIFIIKGKKSKVETSIKNMFKLIQLKSKVNHRTLFIFTIAFSSLFLKILEKKRTKKQRRYLKFPYLVEKGKRIPLGVKNFKTNLTKKEILYKALFKEFIKNKTTDAINNTNPAIIRQKNLYETAFVCKKFANYRWK